MLRYVLLVVVLAGVLPMFSGCASTESGQFVLTAWAPLTGNSFRVNSPDVATGHYADRPEAKATGLLTLAIDEDPATVDAAELYLELWGGHPGVANKRVTVNGRTELVLPEVGAVDDNCTYSYPAIALALADLQRGDNTFQFTCEKGTTFWGHYLLREAAVRLALPGDHARIAAAGLTEFAATVRAEPDGERVGLSLDMPAAMAGRVTAVEYWGRYEGYDENGDTRTNDWHGFTKDQEPVAIIAIADKAGFEATWDITMVPDQATVDIRAIVRFADAEGITYQTPATAIALRARAASVTLHSVSEIHRPFWSRADRVKKARIDLPCAPTDIEKAELHIAIWDGGAGDVADHFTLNGVSVPIAGGGHHDLLYRIVEIDPAILRRGANDMRLLSSTEHHGIEGLLPGPALVIRRRAE